MPASPARKVGRTVAAVVLAAAIIAAAWEPWGLVWAAAVAWAFASQGSAD